MAYVLTLTRYRARLALPTAAAIEAKAPPTEMAVLANPDRAGVAARSAAFTAIPMATASPTIEPTPTAMPIAVEEMRFQSGHVELVR